MVTTAAAPIGWGIVGFGWVAQDYMAPAIREAGDRLVAIVDPDPSARSLAISLGARVYEDAGAMAADPAVEAAYVATPNHLHAVAVAALAAAGTAVLCEKPMAAQLAEAERMAAACRGGGILYGTAFDQRHHPAHGAMRDSVAAGDIGTPTAVRIAYACWVGSDWSAEAGRENWRIDGSKAGGGALIDLAPHGLDLVEFLLGDPVDELTALTQTRVQDYSVDDGAVIVGRTRSGVLVSLHVAYNCPEGLPRRRLEVVGSRAMLVAENTMGQDGGGRVTLVDGRTGEGRVLPVSDASPFLRQVQAFGAALRSGDDSLFSVERDLHTMRLIEMAYVSAAAAPPSPLAGEGVGPKRRRMRGSSGAYPSSVPASQGHLLPQGEKGERTR